MSLSLSESESTSPGLALYVNTVLLSGFILMTRLRTNACTAGAVRL